MARKAKTTAPTAMEPATVEVGAGPAPETVLVRSHRIACDGVGGPLGHPRVWLEMGAAGFVDCPYCDRRFVAAEPAGHDEDEQLAPGVYEGSGGH
ncbi:MAG: zinc-finger domain-containing protein [Caulobacter sp.]|nr:zinc-finger domain-containing protein [Caulobacter sp.]